MVVGAALHAVEAVAVDDAGGAFGGKDLLGGRIVGQPAEGRRAARRIADVGEQRHGAGGPVDPPDGAGAAAPVGRSELAGHEAGTGLAALDAPDPAAGVGNADRQAVDRRRRQIDVGILGIVEGDPEHLTDLAGADGERLGGCALAALGPERGQVDDARRSAAEIDADIVERIGAIRRLGGGDAGKAGDHGIARLDDRLLRRGRADGHGADQREGREADEPLRNAVAG